MTVAYQSDSFGDEACDRSLVDELRDLGMVGQMWTLTVVVF